MRRSNTWFALILIASALLLSAARNVSGEPSGKQNASKAEGYGGEDRASGDVIAPTINQPTAYSTSTEGGRVTYNYNGDFKYVASPNPPESVLRELGDVATVVSTILVMVFTGLLWHVSRQQKKLMVAAEDISRRSVDAAENSLDIYRPYLLVTNISVEASHVDLEDETHHNFYFRIVVKNFGNSPADIVTYIADADIYDPPKGPRRSDPPPAYREEEQLNDSIIGTNEEVPDRLNAPLTLGDREYKLCITDEKRIAIVGRIRYRGASAKVFETSFYYWWFGCDPAMAPIRCFTKRFNDHT